MSLRKFALTSVLKTTDAGSEVSSNLIPCDKEFLLPSQGDIATLDELESQVIADATAALAAQIGFSDSSRESWMKTAEFVALSEAIEEAFVKVRNEATANKPASADWKWTAATAKTSFAREFRTHGDIQRVATWVNIEAKDPNDKRVLYRTYFVQPACFDRDGEWRTDLYRDPNELYL